MELYVNTKLSFRGAAANVKIYTISESLCNEVSKIQQLWDFNVT